MTHIPATVDGASSRTVYFRLSAVAAAVVLLGVAAIPIAMAQPTPAVQAAPQPAIARLTVPADPVARGTLATIRYELTRPGTVTVTIVDARDGVVRVFESPATAGPAAFVWDLRFQGPSPLDEPEPGPLAPAGHYGVRVSSNGEVREASFSVAPAPGESDMTDAQHAQALGLTLEVRQLQSAVNVTLLGLRTTENKARARANQTSGVLKRSARALLRSLAEAQAEFLGLQNVGGSTPTEGGMRAQLTALARDLDRVDGAPPRELRVRVQAAREQVGRLRTQARERVMPTLQDFNAATKSRGIVPLDLPANTWLPPEAISSPASSAGAPAPALPTVPWNPTDMSSLGSVTTDIQFDSNGVEFGSWLRRFVAQVKRNWIIPIAAVTFKGHVVVTFVVHRDGTITDISVARPSEIAGFNKAARGTLIASNPTVPLPAEYPAEHCSFTVTFYYNETSPKR